ncbi:A C2HC-type zinc-finger protein [Toxoplasma gondii FOU]|uniref:A C2HC-type zinc-finger protein n=3 Tax=Toxoplasma gondii TaxID=5811 RepID=A0A086KI98_TOXGO|nr:A C2HC-type zinc-finger protein [Toxoplasma gondii FOU]PUA84907.1 A C2HC-type zinc-finger protein [Toxoplasma gondii TgCATBr9]RQX70104.1 A C2HC-type zinc-finger protein [Toxoplasma gondii CAST]
MADEDSASLAAWEVVGTESNQPGRLLQSEGSAEAPALLPQNHIFRFTEQDGEDSPRFQSCVPAESGAVTAPFSPFFEVPHSPQARLQPDSGSLLRVDAKQIPQFFVTRRVQGAEGDGGKSEGKPPQQTENPTQDQEKREGVQENGARVDQSATEAPQKDTTEPAQPDARQDFRADAELASSAEGTGPPLVRDPKIPPADLCAMFANLSLNHVDESPCVCETSVITRSRLTSGNRVASNTPACSDRQASGQSESSVSSGVERSCHARTRLHTEDLTEAFAELGNATSAAGHEHPHGSPVRTSENVPTWAVSPDPDLSPAASPEGGHHAILSHKLVAPPLHVRSLSREEVPLVSVGIDFAEEKETAVVPVGLRTPSSFSGSVSQQHRPGAFLMRPEEVPLFDTHINSLDDFVHVVEQKEQEEEATRACLCSASEGEAEGDTSVLQLDDKLLPCTLCKRSFAAWRLPRHAQACSRARDARLAFLRRQRLQNPRASKIVGTSNPECVSLHAHAKKARSSGSVAPAGPQRAAQSEAPPLSIEPIDAEASGDPTVSWRANPTLVEAIRQLQSPRGNDAGELEKEAARAGENDPDIREGYQGLLDTELVLPVEKAPEASKTQADAEDGAHKPATVKEEAEKTGPGPERASFETDSLLADATVAELEGPAVTIAGVGNCLCASVSSALFASGETSLSVSRREEATTEDSLIAADVRLQGKPGKTEELLRQDPEEIVLAESARSLPPDTGRSGPVALTIFARSSPSPSASVSSEDENEAPESPRFLERLSHSGASNQTGEEVNSAEERFLEPEMNAVTPVAAVSLPHCLDVQATLSALPLPWELEGERWEPEELETKVCTEEDETDLAALHSPKMHADEGHSPSRRGSPAKVVCCSSHSCSPPSPRSPSVASRQDSQSASAAPKAGKTAPEKPRTGVGSVALRRREAVKRGEASPNPFACAEESVQKKSFKQKAAALATPRTQKPAAHVYSYNPTPQTAKKDGLKSVRPEDRWKLQPTATCPFCSRSFCVKRFEGHVQVCERLRFTRPTVAKKAPEAKTVEHKKEGVVSQPAKRIPIWMRGTVARGKGEEKPESKRSVSAAARRPGVSAEKDAEERRDSQNDEERDRPGALPVTARSDQPDGTEHEGKRRPAKADPQERNSLKTEQDSKAGRLSCGRVERPGTNDRGEKNAGQTGRVGQSQARRPEAAAFEKARDDSLPSLGIEMKREASLFLVPVQQSEVSVSPSSTTALSEALLQIASAHRAAEARADDQRRHESGESRVAGQRLSSGLIKDLVFQLVVMGIQATEAERAAEEEARRQSRSHESPFVSGSRAAPGLLGWKDLLSDVGGASHVQEPQTDSEAGEAGRQSSVGWIHEKTERRSLEGGQKLVAPPTTCISLESREAGRQTSVPDSGASGQDRWVSREAQEPERDGGCTELNGLPWGMLPRERFPRRTADLRDVVSRAELDSHSCASPVCCEVRLAGSSSGYSVASLVDDSASETPREAESEDEVGGLVGFPHCQSRGPAVEALVLDDGLARKQGVKEGRGKADVCQNEGRTRGTSREQVREDLTVVQRHASRRTHQGHVGAPTSRLESRELSLPLSHSSGEDTDVVLPGPDLVQECSKSALKDLIRRSRRLLKQDRGLDPPANSQVESRHTSRDERNTERQCAKGGEFRTCRLPGRNLGLPRQPCGAAGHGNLSEEGGGRKSARPFTGGVEDGSEACLAVAHSSQFQRRSKNGVRKDFEVPRASESRLIRAVDGDRQVRAVSADSERRCVSEADRKMVARSTQKCNSNVSHRPGVSLPRSSGGSLVRIHGEEEKEGSEVSCVARRHANVSSRQTASWIGGGARHGSSSRLETRQLQEEFLSTSRGVHPSFPGPPPLFSSSRDAVSAAPAAPSSGVCSQLESCFSFSEARYTTPTGSVSFEVERRRRRPRSCFAETTDFAARDRPGSPPQLSACVDTRVKRDADEEAHFCENGRSARREVERQSSGTSRSASTWSRQSSSAARCSSVSSYPGDGSRPRSFVESQPTCSSAFERLEFSQCDSHALCTSHISSSFPDESHQATSTPRLHSGEAGDRACVRETPSRNTAGAPRLRGPGVLTSSTDGRPESGVALSGEEQKDSFLGSSWHALQIGGTEGLSRGTSLVARGVLTRGEEHLLRPPTLLRTCPTSKDQAHDCMMRVAAEEPADWNPVPSGDDRVNEWSEETHELTCCYPETLPGDGSVTCAGPNFARCRNTAVPQPYQPPQLGGRGHPRDERTVRELVADQSVTRDEVSRGRALGTSLVRTMPGASQVTQVVREGGTQKEVQLGSVLGAVSVSVQEGVESIKASCQEEHPGVGHFPVYPEQKIRQEETRQGSTHAASLNQPSAFLPITAPAGSAVPQLWQAQPMYASLLPTLPAENGASVGVYSGSRRMSVAEAEAESGVLPFCVPQHVVQVPSQPQVAVVSSGRVARPGEAVPAPGAGGLRVTSAQVSEGVPVVHWEINLKTGQWRSQSAGTRRESASSSVRGFSARHAAGSIPISRMPERHAARLPGIEGRPLGVGLERSQADSWWENAGNCGTLQPVSSHSGKQQGVFVPVGPQASLAFIRAVNSGIVAPTTHSQEPSPLQRQLQQRLLASKSNRWDVSASRRPPRVEETGTGRSSVWGVQNLGVGERDLHHQKGHFQNCSLSLVSQPIVGGKATGEFPSPTQWQSGARFAGGPVNAVVTGTALPQTSQDAMRNKQKTPWYGTESPKVLNWGGARLCASRRLFSAEN